MNKHNWDEICFDNEMSEENLKETLKEEKLNEEYMEKQYNKPIINKWNKYYEYTFRIPKAS
jgi:hypothetical protein